MEINGNNIINGIFKYQNYVKYNKGDLVVFGKSLYRVKEDVINISPIDILGNKYYQLYLDNDIGNSEDFFNYMKDNSNKLSDKLISIKSLSKILNNYFCGFNEKGLIQNIITEENKVFIKDYVKNCFTEFNFKFEYSNPLDSILVEPELNNCVFVVSFNVVSDILGNIPQKNPEKVILRQYTYKNGSNYVRIQELIDYTNGNTKYRSAVSIENKLSFNLNNISWRTESLSSDFIDRVDSIVKKANNIINESNKNNINKVVVDNKQKLQVIGSDNRYDITVNSDIEIITIIFHRVLPNNINESKSITINIKNIKKSSDVNKPAVVEYVAFSDNKGIIKLENKSDNIYTLTIKNSNNIILDKVYGRE